jgi:hypothetical protein
MAGEKGEPNSGTRNSPAGNSKSPDAPRSLHGPAPRDYVKNMQRSGCHNESRSAEARARECRHLRSMSMTVEEPKESCEDQRDDQRRFGVWNSVVRVSVWNQLLNEPQFVRFEVLNSAHQLIAKAFIGLYPDNDENRSKGELVLNVVVPQIDKAENSAANLAVQSYYYRVERGQLSDLTASDRDAVELSLDATDHSLSRAALQQVLDQIPSGDGA